MNNPGLPVRTITAGKPPPIGNAYIYKKMQVQYAELSNGKRFLILTKAILYKNRKYKNKNM